MTLLLLGILIGWLASLANNVISDIIAMKILEFRNKRKK